MPDQAQEQSKDHNQSKYKIKVDGQEVEVTHDELINLAQMGKDYTKKTQAIAAKEKELSAKEKEIEPVKAIFDEMKSNPQLANALNKTYEKVKSGKISTDEGTEANQKTLDKLIKEADDLGDVDTVKNLSRIRKIIADEGMAEAIKEIADLREDIKLLKNATLLSRSESISSNINKLSDVIGKDLVEKYRKDLETNASKYPSMSIEKIFINIASDEDTEQAIINKAKKKKEKEKEIKNNGSSSGGGTTHSRAEPVRDSKGRVDWGKTLDNLKSAGRF